MQDRVKAPAIALIVVGGIGVLCFLGSLGWLAFGGFARQFQSGPQEVPMAAVIAGNVIGMGLSLAGSCFQIYAGLQMQKLRNWGVCVAACIVSMVPCIGCCLVGVPVGIWGLVVLMNDEVKKAFASAAGVSSDI